jgi:hypothetical protein
MTKPYMRRRIQLCIHINAIWTDSLQPHIPKMSNQCRTTGKGKKVALEGMTIGSTNWILSISIKYQLKKMKALN